MVNLKSIGEKYYIHINIINVFLFLFYVLGFNNSFLYTSVLDYKNIKSDTFDGAVYPIEFAPNPFLLSYSERKQDYDTIDSKYFIKIPKYDSSIFGQNPDILDSKSDLYKEVLTNRIIYTIPYLGTYNFDYKEYSGSHPGIDIVVPEGTPIRNIANGVIVDVGYQPAGDGNYVVIRHDNIKLGNGKTTNIYSVYAHMSKVIVSPGTKIKKGELIGYVGHTGTATTSHLHFQIDTEDSPFHPYWPFTSADMKTAGVGFFDGVNIGLGKENAILYTINPLKFVNDNLSTAILTQNNTDSSDVNYTSSNSGTTTEIKAFEVISSSGTETPTVGDNGENTSTNTISPEENSGTVSTNLPETNTPISTGVAKEQTVEKDIELLSAVDDSLVLGDNKDLNSLGNTSSTISGNTDSGLITMETGSDNEAKEDLADLLNNLEDETSSEDLQNKIFSDIENNYKYFEEVKYFKDKGIIAGFSDNTFRPKSNVTRAESLKIIFLSLNISPIEGQESKFLDIKDNSWENNYISSGIKSGMISTQNKYFYPGREINRVEALKLILTIAGVDYKSYDKDLALKDVSNTDWYYDYVNYAIKKNLIETDGDNFYPTKALTREELVSILYKFIKK